MGDEKNIANMAESKIMMTTTVPQIVANGNGTDAISDAPISESPRRGSIASITSINADVPDVVIDDSNDSSRVPTATPVSRSTSGIQANEGIIKKSATKTMSVRSAVNTIAKVTWTSLLENTLILAIDIDNEVNASHDITLNSLKVDITSAVLRPCGPHFDQAVKLLPGDQYTQLYHLTILDDDRKPSIQPPPPQMMVPSFARPGPDGEFPQLFTPAQIESKLREVRLQLSCTVHTATEEIMKREVNSDWRFFVDSSDAAKRRVQEQFRSGGARTVRVFPPSEPMTPQGGPRPGRPSGGSGTPSGGGTLIC
ncbi:hypothetical protein BDF19DRAFT_251025 [Syncephalis fuscata]|nr:hypothetical protein BDF19DRAFT_251025 [Syncephalis fuscata]